MILAIETKITPQDVARIQETKMAVQGVGARSQRIANSLNDLWSSTLEGTRSLLKRGARWFAKEDTPESLVERQICLLRASLEQGRYDKELATILSDAEALVADIKELQLRELMSPLLDNTP